MIYVPNDKWSRKAKEEGYRARSVYKLRELDERFKLIKSGMTVLDAGAAPGSWMQYTSQKVGPTGKVIGLDLQEIEPIAENAITGKVDITDKESVKTFLKKHDVSRIDLVLSDLAPSTSGIRDIDQWRSIELSESTVSLARSLMRRGGICVLKILRGADFDSFLFQAKKHWKLVKVTTVKTSRSTSKEVYVVLKKI
ncbi:RlmE family RNA methyltransferase [Candidatus Peregrinibacteria bacterium]|jgi:23S rRNA (uridine2552-2'-O)-methyltransferase|nr:RlmE family RNA methyltransferase [Candidatus Peregrinibacteria bacterium]MBT3599005.1 RlmE family RNA methyltransferase [Candidatus Peregrinibacteria bacterium]MBT6731094.1 RlmE family RNA methyltransferase [Candidatus Peregrinibacteria bacterium]MBT7009758.1 RlmE family RNA methyltransferase [Candidatus Peregrinibacteria bacterium]MBT7344814.1 RlmE family RNA methyltransferase [Candidatus Peregrinibacteria bacterium]